MSVRNYRALADVQTELRRINEDYAAGSLYPRIEALAESNG